MNNLVFGIPSYKRPDNQRFLKYLKGLGYKKSDIFISTQTIEDFEAYSLRYDNDATVIYRAGSNVCDNKNTLLDTIKGKRIVLVSDKVEALCLLQDNCKFRKIDSRQEFEYIIEWGYSIAKKFRACMWGVYPVGNAFFMSRSINVNQMLLGCFMAFNANTKCRFNPDFPLKEDFEISLRVIASGNNVVRFNNICLKETFHQAGGCKDLWSAKGGVVNRECCEGLLNIYPDLVEKHRTRENELRYIGKTRKIEF